MPIKITRKQPVAVQELPIEKIEVVCQTYYKDVITVKQSDDKIVFDANGAKEDGTVILSKADAIKFANELIKFAEQK